MTTLRTGTTHVDLDGMLADAYNEDGLTPRELLRIHRLARELRLTDQILSTDLDTVSVVPTGPAPAWTTLDGDHVSFSMKSMPVPTTRLDVAVWLGTNAHELGHVLFSPRHQSPLMQRVIEGDRTFLRGIAQLHNIVEDQRQERLILARFSPWRAYLTAALSHHLKADGEGAWILMAGRTWLPDEVRAEARRQFTSFRGSNTADEVAQIIGAYQRLTDPGQSESDEAWELLNQLHDLFSADMPDLPPSCTVIVGGEPDTDPDDTECPFPTADGDPCPGEGEAPGQGDGDEADGKDGNGTGDADSPSSDPGGQGAGKAPGKDKGKAPTDIRDGLRKGARNQLDAPDTADDMGSILDALDHGRGGEADGASPIGEYREATDTARRLRWDVSDALVDLKDQSEPGWVRRTDSGRLNVRRLINPMSDLDELFDRYDPGQMDASEMEVALLLDVSGSMSSKLHRLAEATWAIRHAVDDIDGVVTVITWESGPHRIMAGPGDRPDDRMFVPAAMGGTQPLSALVEAHRIMSDSQAKNRVLVILTDGEWSYDQRNETLIASMAEAGVTTVCVLLPPAHSGGDLHGCQFGGFVHDPGDLAILFRRVAAERIGSWL